MPSVNRTTQANLDIATIWAYIALDNIDAADRWMLKVDSTLSMLARPQAGKHRLRPVKDLYSFPVGNYIIFYRPGAEGIELLRVLHGARRFGPRLFR